MSDAGEIVGMVDVLKLTYATLDQINSMGTSDGEGPAWNKFWLSLDNESESMVSGDGGSRMPHTPDARSLMSPGLERPGGDRGDTVLPNESASHHGADSPVHSAVAGAPHSPFAEDAPFAFKFKAPGGRVHRLQVIGSAGIAELVSSVADKLGKEIDTVAGLPEVEDGKMRNGFALSYLDNEGDSVSITTDKDLLEAILMTRQAGRDKVDLFVHDPEKPALPPTLDPHPTAGIPTPPESVARRRKPFEDDEDEEDEGGVFNERPRRKGMPMAAPPQEQVIQGVPNDLLLPGAIVTLAVVIVGVFALTRTTGNR